MITEEINGKIKDITEIIIKKIPNYGKVKPPFTYTNESIENKIKKAIKNKFKIIYNDNIIIIMTRPLKNYPNILTIITLTKSIKEKQYK